VCGASLRDVSADGRGEPDSDSFPDAEFDDELDEEWLAEWDQADRDAVEVLAGALPDHRGAPRPAELAAVAAAVRAALADDRGSLTWVRSAAGFENEQPPDDDAELLISSTAATISPREETGLDVEEEALLLSLEHADWLGAIVSLVRAGPGADASPDSLVEGIRTCPEVELESEIDIDDELALTAAFSIISLPWHLLGLTDRDERLTPLGAWVLPRALARAWQGHFDQEPTE
jgi:hypothetical protein